MKYFIVLGMLVLFASDLFSQTSPCIRDTSFHIVVLGSSTAAGAGASTSDSAWVNRYRNYLQSINPAYQVTNRAVGGYTTYRLMPSNYTPPSNRPAPSVNNNITYAIGLNPDAIIVNLPSNDVSQGFSVQEQLDNFDTIISHSLNAGIQIWVTTTQPKNYGGNQINIQKQLDVRDSLFARYSPFVIDFWTGLADSTNQLANAYDSGDGTHLNDAGHGLAFSRAAAADLPGNLYSPPPYIDFVANQILEIYNPICGDPQAIFDAVIFNRGLSDSSDVPFLVTAENLSNSQQISYTDTLWGGLNNCNEDTLPIFVNTQQAGDYLITLVLQNSNDPNSANDTVTFTTSVLGSPLVTTIADTGCSNAILTLQAASDGQDSIRWWDAAIGGNLVGSGPVFTTPLLTASATYFAEALRGEFINRNSIFTTNSSTINWNGTMFDLVADSALVLDSIAIKIADVGSQGVIFHTRPGTHLGHETNPASWTPRGTSTVQVADPNIPVAVPISGWAMNPGDTLGVYIQMQNSASRLAYRNPGSPTTRATPELTMITGSGASFNFGGNYYPRDWNGTVYYHFGIKPDGDCQSPRMPAEALISSVSVDLGADTILPLNGSIVLNPGSGYSTYMWSTGATTPTLQLDGSQLGQGIYTISVTVTDSAGCEGTDEIIVVFAPLVGKEDPLGQSLKIWPVPAADLVKFALPEGFNGNELWKITLLDLQGKKVREMEAVCQGSCEFDLNLRNIPTGMYLLEAKQGTTVLRGRVVKGDHR